jgi:glucose-6-phosphate isomerase
MNVGAEPLVYLGIYPSNAGHDYGAIAEKNFKMIVVERDGKPAMLPRP